MCVQLLFLSKPLTFLLGLDSEAINTILSLDDFERCPTPSHQPSSATEFLFSSLNFLMSTRGGSCRDFYR